MRPVVLAIGGSDPTGGAGIQGDVKTIEAHGCHAATAITSVTVQTLRGFEGRADLDASLVREQMRAAIASFDVRAIKTGMLATEGIVRSVAEVVRTRGRPLIVDPVLLSTTGARLLDEVAEMALVNELFRHASVITPNRAEAEHLAGISIRSIADARKAAEVLAASKAKAILIKSAHVDDSTVFDLLLVGGEERLVQQPFIPLAAHGTGCALASAIASRIALGETVDDAVDKAIGFVTEARALAWSPTRGAPHILACHVLLERDASRAQALASVERLAHLAEQESWTNLLPEVGSNCVVLATHARTTEDVATLAGRMIPVNGRLRVTGGATFRPTSHMARFLLAIHQHDPETRAAMNTRYDAATELAFRELGWEVSYFDRTHEPDGAKAREGGTMPWGAAEAMRGRVRAPDVVVDLGETGKERLAKVLAPSPESLAQKLRALSASLASPAARHP